MVFMNKGIFIPVNCPVNCPVILSVNNTFSIALLILTSNTLHKTNTYIVTVLLVISLLYSSFDTEALKSQFSQYDDFEFGLPLVILGVSQLDMQKNYLLSHELMVVIT